MSPDRTPRDADTAPTKHHFGCIADIPDQRDRMFTPAPHVTAAPLPPSVDLTVGFPMPPYDQGQLGSCTANAVAGSVIFDQARQKLPVSSPSRLFQYYNSRALENSIKSDAGATLRDSLKALNKWGECPERDWPYLVGKFASKPPAKAYTDAAKHIPVSYARVNQNLDDMRACLAGGLPFVIGFTVYESFESDVVATNGVVPMPAPTERVLGGHAVVCCAYDDSAKRFRCRNSWGTGWGAKGYFSIPYAYLIDSNLAADFWVVQVVR